MDSAAPNDESDFSMEEVSAWDVCDSTAYIGEFTVNTTVKEISGSMKVSRLATKTPSQQRGSSKPLSQLAAQVKSNNRRMPHSKPSTYPYSPPTTEPQRQSSSLAEECCVETHLTSSSASSTTLERVPMPTLNDPTSPLAQPLTVFRYKSHEELLQDDANQQQCTAAASGVEDAGDYLPHLRVRDDATALCVEGESRWLLQNDAGAAPERRGDNEREQALPCVKRPQKRTETFSSAKAEWARRPDREEQHPEAQSIVKAVPRRLCKNDKPTVSFQMRATRRGSEGGISNVKASVAEPSWQQQQQSGFAYYVAAISAPRRVPLTSGDESDDHVIKATCRVYKEHPRLG